MSYPLEIMIDMWKTHENPASANNFPGKPMDFHIQTLILFIKTTIQVAIGGDLIDGHLHKRAGWNMAEEKQEETMLMDC